MAEFNVRLKGHRDWVTVETTGIRDAAEYAHEYLLDRPGPATVEVEGHGLFMVTCTMLPHYRAQSCGDSWFVDAFTLYEDEPVDTWGPFESEEAAKKWGTHIENRDSLPVHMVYTEASKEPQGATYRAPEYETPSA